jgi:hypothetical protein
MHPDTANVATHMKDFGLCVVGRAIHDAVYSERGRPYAHAMAIGHAAHGTEILVKSRIAQQHPLLIFDGLPSSRAAKDQLTVHELFEHGQTAPWAELPELLWAVTGYRMPNPKRFLDFGRLRDRILHFAVPEIDAAGETLRFAFEVVEPMVADFWEESLVPYAEEWDEGVAAEGYIEEQLEAAGVALTPRLKEVLDRTRAG